MTQTVKMSDVCNLMPKGPTSTYRRLRWTNCLPCLLWRQRKSLYFKCWHIFARIKGVATQKTVFHPFFHFLHLISLLLFFLQLFNLSLSMFTLFPFSFLSFLSCFFPLYKLLNRKFVKFIAEKVNLREVSKRISSCITPTIFTFCTHRIKLEHVSGILGLRWGIFVDRRRWSSNHKT